MTILKVSISAWLDELLFLKPCLPGCDSDRHVYDCPNSIYATQSEQRDGMEVSYSKRDADECEKQMQNVEKKERGKGHD